MHWCRIWSCGRMGPWDLKVWTRRSCWWGEVECLEEKGGLGRDKDDEEEEEGQDDGRDEDVDEGVPKAETCSCRWCWGKGVDEGRVSRRFWNAWVSRLNPSLPLSLSSCGYDLGCCGCEGPCRLSSLPCCSIV